jgi:hypothetical protein
MIDKRMRYPVLLLVMLVLAACGAPPAPALPTAYVVRSSAAPARPIPTPSPLPTNAPETTLALLPTETLVLDSPLDQYRAWMLEARTMHPYSEPIEVMWEVMLCESSGAADTVAGSYYGLFQYEQATWAGDWNPYRTSPILDPRAQIFASAKAWQDGSQHWWGCYQV